MSEDASNEAAFGLRKAIDNVNSVAHNAAVHPKKKKKKRSREVEGAAVEEAAEPSKKRSKKKKRHGSSPDDNDATSAADPIVPAQPIVQTSIVDQAASTGITSTEKPKKKKKNKGKQRAVEEGGHHESRPSNLDDDRFVSIVLAAATGSQTPEGQSSEGQPSVGPSVPPAPSFPNMPPAPHYPFLPQYVPYAPQQAMPYIPPPAPFGHAPQAQPGFPDFSNLALPDIVNASSDDILRGLQNLDMDKIAHLVKSLGEVAVMASVSLSAPPSFVQHPAPAAPPPVRQVPARSDAILGRPPKQPKPPGQAKQSRVLPMNLPPPPQEEIVNPDHAHMLANTWMSATKLVEMAKKEGLVYKKGKFSAIEEAQLNAAIENWRVQRGLTKEQLLDVIFSKDKGRDSFWPEITAALHLRPIIAVYHHVRRAYHPMAQQGRWMPAEDDALRKTYAEYGSQWEKISTIVGRTSGDCRDRYRNHLENQDKRRNGPWTKEEEEELTKLVLEMTVEQGKDIDNDVFWGVVSQRMGGRRGRQQCRIKWTDSLSNQFKNRGQKPRWSQMDSYLLVHKVASLNVRDDSEIDWKQLPDMNWNTWSAHQLQRRWKTLKDSIKDSKHMSHAEIMEILRNKKAQSPPPPAASRKKKLKAATSAEVIQDSDDEDTVPVAGPSARPGTAAA